MANSLIEDVLNDPINENGKGKKPKKQKPNKPKKIKIIVILIIFLIIIICAIMAISYLQSKTTELSSKAGFFEYLTSSNVENVTDLSLYSELVNKVLDENSTIETTAEIEYTSESFSISDIELVLNSENDAENNKSYTDVNIMYSDNDLFEFEFFISNDFFAVTSEEIVNAFVNIPYDYFEDDEEEEELNISIFSDEESEETEELEPIKILDIEDETSEDEVSEIETETSDENTEVEEAETEDETEETDETKEETEDDAIVNDISEVIKSALNISMISDESVELYKNILNKNLEEDHFSSRTVTLSLDSETVIATEYALSLTEEEFIDLAVECLETLETDADTIESISGILYVLELTEEEFVSSVDDLILEVENYETKGENITICVYESEGQTVELTLQYSSIKLEMQYEYGEKENSVKISYETEETNGVSCKFTNSRNRLNKRI